MNAVYVRDLFDPPVSERTVERFRRRLSEAGRCRVDLTVTRNRVSMIAVVFARPGYARIRLHEQFLNAPPTVLDALSAYLRTQRRADWAVVSAYARCIPVPPAPPRRRMAVRLVAQGQVYDLSEIAREVNERYFNGRIRCRIGWGPRRTRPRRRVRSYSIRYGSWSASSRTIRIHPLLDDSRVPREFVTYIVYHEMLHAAIPARMEKGRRMDHGPVFRQQEASYPDIARMRVLATDLLDVLLASSRVLRA